LALIIAVFKTVTLSPLLHVTIHWFDCRLSPKWKQHPFVQTLSYMPLYLSTKSIVKINQKLSKYVNKSSI